MSLWGDLLSPAKWATLARGYKFHFELRRLKKDLGVKRGMAITEDQQGLKFVPCNSYTMEYKGAKEVRIGGGRQAHADAGVGRHRRREEAAGTVRVRGEDAAVHPRQLRGVQGRARLAGDAQRQPLGELPDDRYNPRSGELREGKRGRPAELAKDDLKKVTGWCGGRRRRGSGAASST